MKLTKSNRPQNLHPDALIQSRKQAARLNLDAVRVTVQAMQHRKTDPQKITVQAVAKEAGVSAATIYRRDELFALIRKANPDLQRRQAEQVHQNDLAALQAKLVATQKEKEYYQKEAELAKIGSQGLKQEITQLRKKKLELQREIARLESLVRTCTCGNNGPSLFLPVKG
jgi:chromosome segregation ATPase